MRVSDIQDREDLVLVDRDYDVREMADYLGPDAKGFDGFFVKVEEGDIVEAYGFEGSIPYLSKTLYRIARKNPSSKNIQPGDSVMFSKKFLRSIGALYGDLPFAKGIVRDIKGMIATVMWEDPSVPGKVHINNLVRVRDIPYEENPRKRYQYSLWVKYRMQSQPEVLLHAKSMKAAKILLKDTLKEDYVEDAWITRYAGGSNPPKNAVEIYGNVLRIEAKKGEKSLWPHERFYHDFNPKKGSAKIFGLPDGSLLIKGKKKLWKKFSYGPEDIR